MMRRNDVLCHINERQREKGTQKCAAGGLETLNLLSQLYRSAQASRCFESDIGVAVPLYRTFVITTMKKDSALTLSYAS